jgi:Mg2+ and Co2+ transporter CorA
MWGMNLKGVPALINSYMTWDGVAYIGAIDLLASLNPLTRN